jgi:cytidyltransferase-like protein
MRVARSVSELERAPRAVAVGSFDGVHRGHRRVLSEAVESGLRPTVVTFYPHPRTVLGNRVDLLTTLERRLELLEEAGIEETLVLEFTLELAEREPADFAERMLRPIGAEIVVAGESFRFGRARSGDPALLSQLGFDTRVVPAVAGISSTRVRQLLREGQVDEAARLLGRAPEVDGVVVAGDARLPDGESASRSGAPRPEVRDLRRTGGRAPRRGVDRREPALQRHRAPRGGVPPRLRGRPLRRATSRRAVGATSRRARVRERVGARGPDRGRRRAHAKGPASRSPERVSVVTMSARSGLRRDLSLRDTAAHGEPSGEAAGEAARSLSRLRGGIRQTPRARYEAVEPGLPRVRLPRLGADGRYSARAAPSLRGSPAAPLRVTRLTPPK